MLVDYVLPEIRKTVNVFMSKDGIGRRYLLGRNEYSKLIADVIEIDGFIDDFTEIDIWNNKAVLKSRLVPANAIVINCSMSIAPVAAHKKVQELGIKSILSYIDLSTVNPSKFPLPSFVLETRKDVSENLEKWKKLYNSFDDEKSRQVLDDVLSYRITGNYNFMKNFKISLQEQYFEEFFKLDKGEIFVDSGGFNGDTTEEFCKYCPDYNRIYFFEPSLKNLSAAKSRLNKLKNIDFIDLGISDKAGELSFDSDAGSACSITESGKSVIRVTTLDLYIKGKITFIKMDLEGWELNALKGARTHIINDYPKLAIAVYHKSSDFWKIFEYVSSLRNDYKIFLRHYTEGWSETVLFFLPVFN